MAGYFSLKKRPGLAKKKKEARNCFYCLKPMSGDNKTLDHKIPRSRGGPNAMWNIVICCRKCNVMKGNKPADQFITELVRKQIRKENGNDL